MAELEHLTKLIESAIHCGANTPEKIAERLIDDGVMCPRYKRGDTVYFIRGLFQEIIRQGTVRSVAIESGRKEVITFEDEFGGIFHDDAERHYPTREEAEAALAERRKS